MWSPGPLAQAQYPFAAGYQGYGYQLPMVQRPAARTASKKSRTTSKPKPKAKGTAKNKSKRCARGT